MRSLKNRRYRTKPTKKKEEKLTSIFGGIYTDPIWVYEKIKPKWGRHTPFSFKFAALHFTCPEQRDVVPPRAWIRRCSPHAPPSPHIPAEVANSNESGISRMNREAGAN